MKAIKKLLLLGLICCLAVACFSAVSCESHEHTFSSEWTSDENNHWHAATCGHDNEKKDEAAHTFGENGKCTVCGYGKDDPQTHEHTFSQNWTSDESKHWHAATCGHDNEKKDEAAHTFDSNGKCKVCGYQSKGEIMEYTITALRSSGDPLDNVSILALDSEGRLGGSGMTDDRGVAVMNMAKGEYTLQFAFPTHKGYHETDGADYTISADTPERTFRFAASLIEEAAPRNTRYELGDVMYDFSFTTTKGVQTSLGQLLSEKKMVLLNFWYTTCTYCLREFPDIKEVYQEYEESVAVVALNPMNSDAECKSFCEDESRWGEGGLPFHIVGNGNACTSELASTGFRLTGYPASVIIDREGVICFIAGGAGTREDFVQLFEKYSAEPYEQDIMFPGENAAIKPDVTAPASAEIEAAINNTDSGFTASYYFVPAGQESSHEYNWPWVIGHDEEGDYIYPSNSLSYGENEKRGGNLNNTYAILYTDITVAKNQIIVFDYRASCEYTGNAYGDFLQVFVDNTLITSISGNDGQWRTCYAYFPYEAGTYTLSLAYVKDESNTEGDDAVYVKNMRFLDASELHARMVMPYKAAYGNITQDGKYEHYITPVYNKEDGYYHVGTEDGPLLLADFMNRTNWSSDNIYSYVANGGFLYDLNGDGREEDLTHRTIEFCQYANNSEDYGLIAVTEEIRSYLIAITKYYKEEEYKHLWHEQEWLEFCTFYVVYGGAENEQLPDPARGLAAYNSFKAVLNTGTESAPNERNHVVINRIIVPRGISFRFDVPKSGVYRINSLGDFDTYGWLRDKDFNLIMENDDLAGNFNPDDIARSDGNFSMTKFMAEGETYYISCAFFGIEEMGSFDFIITCIAEEGDFWMPASSGEYTWELVYDDDGNLMYDQDGEVMLGDIIVKDAIDVKLDEDKQYRAVNADGTLGGLVYVNFSGPTAMFEMALSDMINISVYYCKNCGYVYPASVAEFDSTDDPICVACGRHGKDNFESRKAFELPTPVRGEDGKIQVKNYLIGAGTAEAYTISVPQYEKDENGNIKFTDYTDRIEYYRNLSQTEFPTDDGEHRGFTVATEELVDILQKFIVFGDHSFDPNIDNAWLLLSFYYLHLGPAKA